MVLLILILIGIIILSIFIIKTYNNLIKLKNKVKNSWAHIDAQLQRRFDLLPNLVEIVREFTEHEEKILDKVISIRSDYINARTNREKLTKDAELSSLLKSLFVISNNYPKLKSDLHFLKLQDALTEIEEDISYARQFYNDSVTIYNNKLMSFPNNLIASVFGFEEEALFQAFKENSSAPRIHFNKKHHCPSCGACITHEGNNCEFCGCSLY